MNVATQLRAREERKLKAIARQYREEGYHVLMRPRGGELPPFLADYEPDLVARSDVESVVVEVRSGQRLTQSADLTDLATRISAQPGWRFELVVTNPRDGLDLEDLRLWDMATISERLADAREVAQTGHSDAAFLHLWAATEAALRRLACQEGMPVEERPVAQIAKELAVVGVIERDAYTFLREVASLRDELGRGIGRHKVDTASVERLA